MATVLVIGFVLQPIVATMIVVVSVIKKEWGGV